MDRIRKCLHRYRDTQSKSLTSVNFSISCVDTADVRFGSDGDGIRGGILRACSTCMPAVLPSGLPKYTNAKPSCTKATRQTNLAIIISFVQEATQSLLRAVGRRSANPNLVQRFNSRRWRLRLLLTVTGPENISTGSICHITLISELRLKQVPWSWQKCKQGGRVAVPRRSDGGELDSERLEQYDSEPVQ
jgi:hypothetical protein